MSTSNDNTGVNIDSTTAPIVSPADTTTTPTGTTATKKSKSKVLVDGELAKPLQKLLLFSEDDNQQEDTTIDEHTKTAASERWQRKVEKKLKQIEKNKLSHGSNNKQGSSSGSQLETSTATSTIATASGGTKKKISHKNDLSWPTEEKRTAEWAAKMDDYFERNQMPVKTRYDPKSGFGLVATRNIKKGEVVVKESIFLATVCENVKEKVCSHCFKHVLPQPNDSYFQNNEWVCQDTTTQSALYPEGKFTISCSKCHQMFYCSQECLEESTAKFHNSIECNALSQLGVDAIHPDDVFSDLLRQALRMIAVRFDNVSTRPLPEETILFNSFTNMQKNLAFSPPLADDNDTLLKTVAKLANELVPAKARIPLPEFVDLYKRHQCNAFSMLGPNRVDTAYGCYITCWHLMNHSCVPVLMREHHAFHRPLVDGLPLFEARAIVDVAENEEITWCYSNIRTPPEARREKLKQFYGFICGCPRCVQGETKCLEKYPNYRGLLCKRRDCGFILPFVDDNEKERVILQMGKLYNNTTSVDDKAKSLLGFCNQCGLSRYENEEIED